MSADFSILNVSQPNSSSFVSETSPATVKQQVSMYSSRDNINLFDRARKSGYPGLADSPFRMMLYSVIGGKRFNNFILLMVMLNTVNMVFQTTLPFAYYYGYYLSILDSIFLGIYVMEMFMKLLVFRKSYFKSGWNIFDFTIVSMSVASTIIPLLVVSGSGTSKLKILTTFKAFKVIKAVRALRVLRTISFLKSLQVVVATLLRSIPALSYIIALSVLILVMFGVVAKELYGDVDPDNFGSVGDAIFALLFAMSLDQWSDLWQNNEPMAPSIGYFLAVFVFIENFVMLNVFVAVLVSNLESSRKVVSKEIKRDERPSTDTEDATNELSSSEGTNNSMSSLKFTSIDEYHPDLSIKYKQLQLLQQIYEELTDMDETFYYLDQQNRLLNALLTKE